MSGTTRTLYEIRATMTVTKTSGTIDYVYTRAEAEAVVARSVASGLWSNPTIIEKVIDYQPSFSGRVVGS